MIKIVKDKASNTILSAVDLRELSLADLSHLLTELELTKVKILKKINGMR